MALSPPYGRPVNDCMSRIDGVAFTGFCLTEVTYATPGMFHTLQMKVFAGRVFSEADTADTGKVAVVNRAFARRYLKNRADPIDSTVTIENKDWRVIGIVSDVPQENSWGEEWGPIDAVPQVYLPVAQFPDGLFAMANVWFSPVWMVRTHSQIHGLAEQLGRALAAVDPAAPLFEFSQHGRGGGSFTARATVSGDPSQRASGPCNLTRSDWGIRIDRGFGGATNARGWNSDGIGSLERPGGENGNCSGHVVVLCWRGDRAGIGACSHTSHEEPDLGRESN